MEEVLAAEGHERVRARHTSTLEVTTDPTLTPTGDCIIGVVADRAPADFDPSFVDACRSASATIVATIDVDGLAQTVRGRGDPDLTMTNDRSAVLRTSRYVDDRTVMVAADGAAADVDRELVRRLQDGAELTVRIAVNP